MPLNLIEAFELCFAACFSVIFFPSSSTGVIGRQCDNKVTAKQQDGNFYAILSSYCMSQETAEHHKWFVRVCVCGQRQRYTTDRTPTKGNQIKKV